MTVRVLIADDEPLVREELRHLLAQESGVDLVGECRNGGEAVEAVRALRPDLLLLDVQMPGLDGFGVLYELHPGELPLVIFVTAYDRYALKAFEVHAADYLLKPVDPRRFRESIQRVKSWFEASPLDRPEPRLESLLREVAERRQSCHRLAVPDGGRILFLPTESLYSVQAAENYVLVHSAKGKFLLHETLTRIFQRLAPEEFARVHRSWIVRLRSIREVVPKFHRTYLLVLENGQRVPVSSSYRGAVERLLGRS